MAEFTPYPLNFGKIYLNKGGFFPPGENFKERRSAFSVPVLWVGPVLTLYGRRCNIGIPYHR
jgi:hypothetical protein